MSPEPFVSRAKAPLAERSKKGYEDENAIYPPGWREALRSNKIQAKKKLQVRVKYLVQEHNAVTPVWAQTRTVRSEVQATNH